MFTMWGSTKKILLAPQSFRLYRILFFYDANIINFILFYFACTIKSSLLRVFIVNMLQLTSPLNFLTAALSSLNPTSSSCPSYWQWNYFALEVKRISIGPFLLSPQREKYCNNHFPGVRLLRRQVADPGAQFEAHPGAQFEIKCDRL